MTGPVDEVEPGAAALTPSALSDDQLALARVARSWLVDRSPMAVARAHLDAPVEVPAELPGFWPELTEMGWVALAVPAELGGQGGSLGDLAVVLEEWGRACAPGPFPPTALAATLLASAVRAVPTSQMAPEPAPEVREALGDILGGASAAVVFDQRAIDAPADVAWLLWVDEGSGGVRLLRGGDVSLGEVPGADPTRRPAVVSSGGPESAETGDPHRLGVPLALEPTTARLVAAVVAGAEAVGVAAWCVHTAAQWACTREQFDRPIGMFQAVKHRVADSLCRLELARAAVWDAAQLGPDDPEFALSAAAAGALGTAAAFECAKDVVQVLGGIGYTWEHDAHLYLRRATHLHHLGARPGTWHDDLVAAVEKGQSRSLRVELPQEADEVRARVRDEVAAVAALPKEQWNVALAEGGWLQPHWPRPWGRDAGALEQIVVDQELAAAGIRRPHLQVAGWVLPTLIAHGTAEQQDRWVLPSLRGEITWCQLFSEPGAGSDLAALSTKAERTDGGWSVTGQKVWTTLAREAQYGLCLVRTDPSAPKHEGISAMVIDMAAPGVDVRPLRELTGFAMFNEVFLDAVFVPDGHVVGAVDDGWRCARTTLENERVSMASGSSFGPGVRAVFDLARERGLLGDPRVRDLVGSLLVDSQALGVLGVRTTLRALARAASDGPGPAGGTGPEASVRKLMAVEHEQAVQEAAMALLGPEAVVQLGEGGRWFGGFLGNRALSIAGGTSEIQRNVIAERLLGLPRD